MEVLLGGLTSLLYGVADFLGGEGAKRTPAASFVLWSGVLSFPVLLVVALGVGGEATAGDFVLGALAGASGAFGLVFLFAGLARGHAAAVAPVSAAFAALVPVIVAVIDGERPTLLAWAGVGVAVPAIVLCSWVTEPGDVALGGFFYGLIAGLGFGGFTAIIRFTSETSNLLPLVASRGATMVVVLGIGLFGLWRIKGPSSVPWVLVAANGILDVTANVTLLMALRSGSLALAAVAASFFPAVTVILARWVNQERLALHQTAGLGLTVVALAAISIG